MKIQCDVCNKDEASVFCTADEASLCDTCDHRVHHANKLASKHQRFSLLHPSSQQIPLCDICQEKRAFLFCQQDRAILCRDCDVPIHSVNELTKKHNRFLLTGVKLSASSAVYTPPPPSSSPSSSSVLDSSNSNISSIKKQITTINNCSANNSFISKTTTTGDKLVVASESGGSGSTSSISEYLIKTIPGWHVEDFLDSSSDPFGFNKNNDGLLPFCGTESNMSSFSSENMGIWVPQAPMPLHPCLFSSQIGGQIVFKETNEVAFNNNNNWKYNKDDGFTVPQISPPTSKRSRPNFW